VEVAGSVDHYHVHRPEQPRRIAAVPALLAVVAVVVWLAAAIAFRPVRVTVDGATHIVPTGTTAAEIVRRGLVKAPRGDLRSITGGVARRRGGMPPSVRIDGAAASLSARIPDGAVIESVRGRDVTESVVTTVAATPVPVVESGTGPELTIISLGSAGLAVVRMGTVSHSIIESTPLAPASPMMVRRSPLSAGSRVIALTFDDGPWPGQTERVLDILKNDGVRATFFMLGIRARIAPDLAKRVVAEGHSVGNHTQSHAQLRRVSPGVVRAQMEGGRGSIEAATGVKTVWFRAPGGEVSPVVMAEAQALGERVIRWDVDPADWRKPPAPAIVGRVVGGLRPGAVVLLHDGGGDRNQTIAALPEIIRIAREQGYRFVTLDEMYAGK
jgi:peptidoglycan/xylan/chitin deacetylase (PgdA/CDA1 family)